MSEAPIDHKVFFDKMPVPRFLVEPRDGAFYLIAVNELGRAFFNEGEADILQKDLDSLIPSVNYNLLFESLETARRKNMVVTVPSFPDCVSDIKSSGFWVNPIPDENGTVIYLDIIGKPGATDVAVVRRERDDALSLLTAVFNTLDVGIIVVDRNRRIVKVNDSFHRIYGWEKRETIGHDFVEFITEDDQKIATDRYTEFFDSVEKRHSGEVKVICKDGTIDNVMFTTATLQLSHGRVFQVITLVDITSRKKMELSLRVAKDLADSANNAKSAFLANMSHELRTPLNAIIGFSEMMVNESFGALGNKKYNEYISDVYMSATHLLEIINEVLDMSKIESGKTELDEHEIDLNTLIHTLMRVMNSKILSENITIEEEYQQDLPKLRADPRLIRQILINLVTNSIKYSVNGGTIRVLTKLNDRDEIEISVIDEGVGIPADKIKEALEPFGQIHDPSLHNQAYQGTGLGLPLSKAMVEMHGGDFILRSVDGQGTQVHISFPKSRTHHH